MKTDTVAKVAHTPTLVLPLQIISNGTGVNYLCDSSNGKGAGREIATFTSHLDGVNNFTRMEEDDTDWEYIVRAVNAHEELVAACRKAAQWMTDNSIVGAKQNEVFYALRDAIAHAEAK